MMTKKGLFAGVLILSIICSLWLAIATLSDVFKEGRAPEEVATAAKLNPLNATNYYYLGLIKHYDRENMDLGNAVQLYKEALLKNPLYPNVWYDLAHAYIQRGDKDGAFSSIENYYRLSHYKPEGIWNTALFYYIQTNKIDTSLQYLKRLVSIYPDEINRVFNLLVLSDVGNEDILSNIISVNKRFYSEYLRYLVRLNDLERAMDYWNLVDPDSFDRKTKIRFCNSLLFSERYNNALSVWKEVVSNSEMTPSDNLLYNGGFEAPLVNGCLGWIARKKEGVLIGRSRRNQYEGDLSFEISFDGRHNTDIFALRQSVLVEPGSRYNLSAMIKTDNITTTNGLFLQVYGFRCDGLNVRTRTVRGTNDWTEMHRTFEVPSGCSAIVVALRRAKSHKFNNKIKGTAWVDSVRLTKVK